MAHKTKVGGTVYEITGGTTKVGGTKYSIAKGRTKVGGTGYDISFTPPGISVTITGSGNSSYCYAKHGSTKYYEAGEFSVLPGDTIVFGVYGISDSNHGYVRINGEEVLYANDEATETYTWTVPTGITRITVNMTYTSNTTRRNGKIAVYTWTD